MCNACGFACCAYDSFSRCGCDCDEPLCRDVCRACGQDEDYCVCEMDDDSLYEEAP